MALYRDEQVGGMKNARKMNLGQLAQPLTFSLSYEITANNEKSKYTYLSRMTENKITEIVSPYKVAYYHYWLQLIQEHRILGCCTILGITVDNIT